LDISLLKYKPNSGEFNTEGHIFKRPKPALYLSASLFLNEKYCGPSFNSLSTRILELISLLGFNTKGNNCYLILPRIEII
jgi:hypothetical protein